MRDRTIYFTQRNITSMKLYYLYIVQFILSLHSAVTLNTKVQPTYRKLYYILWKMYRTLYTVKPSADEKLGAHL